MDRDTVEVPDEDIIQVDGKVHAMKSKKFKLPRRGHIKRYLLTSIQNNTHLHPGYENILSYCEWLDGLPKASCQLIVGTYSYQLAAYGAKAVKRGHNKAKVDEELWYAPEVLEYVQDKSIELAPGLVWCGEQNILPTTRHPLSSFEDYNGRNSNIVPHAKIAMESVASMADEATKFNYSTGTITQRNYIQKRAGILAEQKHAYGAALVEVDSAGNWWVRQLHLDSNDVLMDVGPDGYSGVEVRDGWVEAKPVVEGIYWGDVHASELENWVRELAWGPGGMLDCTKAQWQFMGDLLSMRSRTHHEIGNFHRSYQKHVDSEESVEDEVQLTADFMHDATRDWCNLVVVQANHDRHLDRWLNEADFRADPVNAKYFLELQWQVLDAIDRGDRHFNIMEWSLNQAQAPKVKYLRTDESCVVAGIENGLHGDLGMNGSRGSTRGLTKLGRGLNKGHDHTAAIRDGVYSAGACSLSFGFMMGPNSHSISHIVTYANGKRAIITMWNDKWRA